MYRIVVAAFFSAFVFFGHVVSVQAAGTARSDQNEITPELAAAKEKARALAVQLQTELNRVGCNPGDLDGYWGRNSYMAMKAFNKATEEKLLVYKPTKKALDVIRVTKGKICPETRVFSNSYDGVYQINGERIKHFKKVWCNREFEMKFQVQNGRVSHKIPLGHYLTGNVKDNRLYLSSTPEKNGGHWVGIFALGKAKKDITPGTFKWTGAKDGATCAYQTIIRRL